MIYTTFGNEVEIVKAYTDGHVRIRYTDPILDDLERDTHISNLKADGGTDEILHKMEACDD